MSHIHETEEQRAFLELLAQDLEPMYEPRLPYHNWDEHIQNGMSQIDALAQEATEHGRPVDIFMAKVAYMGHDVGYSHDLLEPNIWQPFGSKEAYSAHIMGVLLGDYGFEESFIEGVQTCIMFTKMDETLPEDLDEVVANTATAVRMIDLFNVFGSYKGFVVNSFKLMEEDRVYGRQRSLPEFKKITEFVLTNFLSVDFLPVANCRVVNGLHNVDKFTKDSPSKLLRVLGSYAGRFAGLIRKDVA